MTVDQSKLLRPITAEAKCTINQSEFLNYLSLAQGAGKTTRTQRLDFSKVLTPRYTGYKSYAFSLRSLEFGRQYRSRCVKSTIKNLSQNSLQQTTLNCY